MPAWSAFASAAPELAADVLVRLDAHVHKTLATIRADGSPRISGTETLMADGELWVGSMWGARKARDLQPPPPPPPHSGSDDPPAWTGDAKLAGVVEEVADPARVRDLVGRTAAPPGPAHVFRLDLREVSTVGVGERALRITVWTPASGVRTFEREG